MRAGRHQPFLIRHVLGLLFVAAVVAALSLSMKRSTVPGSNPVFTQLDSAVYHSDSLNSVGAAWVDYDGDGALELYVLTGDSTQSNFLYRHAGDDQFESITGLNILDTLADSYSCTWADYDNDGLIDVFVTNNTGPNYLFHGVDNGGFELIRDGSDLVTFERISTGASWGDYNNDGLLDLLVVSSREDKNELHLNTGSGFLLQEDSPVVTVSGDSRACAFIDIDDDGDLDIYISNGSLSGGQNNLAFENMGNGEFVQNDTTVIANDLSDSRGGTWGDFDNDGDMDLFVGTGGLPAENNHLYINNGNWAFDFDAESIISNGIGQSWSASWVDYNNDGYLDLFVSNTKKQQDFFYINPGDGSFQLLAEGDIIDRHSDSKGNVWGDYDGDGDLDVFVSSTPEFNNGLFRNDSDVLNWIDIQLEGVVANRSGIGSRIIVVAALDGVFEPVRQTRHIGSQTSLQSQSAPGAWFGIGSAASIDSIIVKWPGGNQQVLTGVAANQQLLILESVETTEFEVVAIQGGDSHGAGWADINNDGLDELFVANGTAQDNFLFDHEDDSTLVLRTVGAIVGSGGESSGVSWGDFNNDGYIDLFVANSSAQDNFLYRNDQQNDFIPVTGDIVVEDGENSRGGAWADIDNDGWLDLCVVNVDAPDHIYRNLGDGSFELFSAGALDTAIFKSKGCAWSDYDLDGDADLLIVTAEDEPNTLWQNDGSGSFTLQSLATIGDLATDVESSSGASWGDYDNDGDPDVFITTDMDTPNLLYENLGNGSFARVASGTPLLDAFSSTGSAWGDVDNDGDLDLYVVNRFEKNQLFKNNGTGIFFEELVGTSFIDDQATLTVALSDFDSNGTLDIVIPTANDAEPTILLRNMDDTNNWVQFRLTGVANNTSALGARLYLYAMIDGQLIRQSREVSSQTGNKSQNSLTAHFGLGMTQQIDSLVIEWPTGLHQVVAGDGVAVNETAWITEQSVQSDSVAGVSWSSAIVNATVLPTEAGVHATVEYGLDKSLRMEAIYAGNPITGTDLHSFSVPLSALEKDTTYYYRVKTVFGKDLAWTKIDSFTTADIPVYPISYELNHQLEFPHHDLSSSYRSEDYRLVGLPGDGGDIRVEELLPGEQGTDWQVYWDNGSNGEDPSDYLVELNDDVEFRFEIGRAFWLVHKGTWNLAGLQLDTAPLQGGAVEIPLHPGWNLITNPYDTTLVWSRVLAANNIFATLWGYQGFESPADHMLPFTGYYFNNSELLSLSSLKIPYEIVYLDPDSQSVSRPDWKVDIHLLSESKLKGFAAFGSGSEAKNGWDQLDQVYPSRSGQTANIYFDSPSDAPIHSNVAVEMKPSSGRLQFWRFYVRTEPGSSYTLNFSNIESIPLLQSVVLYSEAGGHSVSLREQSEYSFRSQFSRSSYVVAVGEAVEVESFLESILPEHFELGDNYPNPFNPRTNIPIALPRTADINLEVFNILGQSVVSLFSGELSAGRYVWQWDGRNQFGHEVASGIYIVRFAVHGGPQLTSRILLLK